MQVEGQESQALVLTLPHWTDQFPSGLQFPLKEIIDPNNYLLSS